MGTLSLKKVFEVSIDRLSLIDSEKSFYFFERVGLIWESYL